MNCDSISIPEHVLCQRTGNAMVLLDSIKGQYFELNESAASAFEVLLETQNPVAACAAITAEFDVTQDQAKQDLDQLIEELANAGLIQMINNAR